MFLEYECYINPAREMGTEDAYEFIPLLSE